MIWTSPYPPLEPGGPPLPDLVLGAARRDPQRAALIDAATGDTVSYATLAERIERVATGLGALGFAAGDVLAVHAPNVPAWAGVALGALRAGGAVTGIGPAATASDAERQLRTTGATVLVTAPPAAEVALRAAAASGVREVVAIGDVPGTRPIAELLGAGGPAPAVAPEPGGAALSPLSSGTAAGPAPAVSLEPERPALLPLSSGTTGLPKAVVLTHGNVAAGVEQVRRGLALSPPDTVLGVAPYAHVMGFVGALAAPLAAGATVVAAPRFELPALAAAIERHRVTVLIGPPPLAAALVAGLGTERDLSALELVVIGGAPLAPGVQERLAERLAGATVAQGYGMTETTLPIPIPDRRRGTRPGAAGRLAPSTELRVVDPVTGRDRPAGEAGELSVRGPQVTSGYLGDPESTAALFDRDGWLRTGDLGVVDGDGEVRVVDRLKELIKVNALQVAPAELEALLLTRPDVDDAAVVGRPDAATGEAPVAVVVPRGALDPDELIAWVAARVAIHKRLAAVVLAEQIPRTPSGKVLRRELRAAIAAAGAAPRVVRAPAPRG